MNLTVGFDNYSTMKVFCFSLSSAEAFWIVRRFGFQFYTYKARGLSLGAPPVGSKVRKNTPIFHPLAWGSAWAEALRRFQGPIMFGKRNSEHFSI
jgi:hypothetical protein